MSQSLDLMPTRTVGRQEIPVCVLLGILGIQGEIVHTLSCKLLYAHKTEGDFHWKELIRVKSKGFTQVEFLMPSTSIKSRDLFKYTVTVHFFRRDFANRYCKQTM